jgi:polyhydroxybutyrate depolymerase
MQPVSYANRGWPGRPTFAGHLGFSCKCHRRAAKAKAVGQSGLVNGMLMRGCEVVRIAIVAALFAACWLLLGLAELPSAAFAAAGRVTVMSEGISRTAILVQHRRLKQGRRPTIIILRGGRVKGLRPRRMIGLEEWARSSGAVFVYPEPLSGHWADAPGPEANRDSAFIHDLVAKLVAEGITNPSKVFLAGTATGGMMAFRLACDPKNNFSGLAILGASLPSDLVDSCKPARPIPLLMIAGTADPAVPFQGGQANLPHGKVAVAPVETALGLFGKAAGCGEGTATSVLTEKEARDGTRAFLDKLINCKVPVELIRIEGGSHLTPAIPGQAATGSEQGLIYSEVNSARLIWDFFRPLGG